MKWIQFFDALVEQVGQSFILRSHGLTRLEIIEYRDINQLFLTERPFANELVYLP